MHASPSCRTATRLLPAVLLGALLAILLAAAGVQASETAITSRGQDVTIIEGRERTVYEYRQNGVLRMIRVVPAVGRPYYLTPADPTRGYGNLEQADMLLPRWILVEF
ncbi:MAG: DUF2782 domain-containing protein [Gammaproteobacteria bacterium]|nr:DUF2782 domain-containing protein [Gammaproteobacteria bacterium]